MGVFKYKNEEAKEVSDESTSDKDSLNEPEVISGDSEGVTVPSTDSSVGKTFNTRSTRGGE